MTSPAEPSDLLPCPFCGHQHDHNDQDVLHPSGSAWQETEDGIRHYVRAKTVDPQYWCYQVNCPTSHGGCGAELTADSRDEAIAAWNRRIYAALTPLTKAQIDVIKAAAYRETKDDSYFDMEAIVRGVERAIAESLKRATP